MATLLHRSPMLLDLLQRHGTSFLAHLPWATIWPDSKAPCRNLWVVSCPLLLGATALRRRGPLLAERHSTDPTHLPRVALMAIRRIATITPPRRSTDTVPCHPPVTGGLSQTPSVFPVPTTDFPEHPMTSPPHLRPATLLMVHSMERLLRGLQLAIRLTPHLTTMGQDPSILTWNGVLQTMVLPRSTTSVSEACPGGARLHEDRVAERRRLEAVEACHFHLLRGTAVRLLCLATKSNPCKDLVLGQRRGETSAPAVAAEGLENKNWPEKPWTKLRIYWPR